MFFLYLTWESGRHFFRIFVIGLSVLVSSMEYLHISIMTKVLISFFICYFVIIMNSGVFENKEKAFMSLCKIF